MLYLALEEEKKNHSLSLSNKGRGRGLRGFERHEREENGVPSPITVREKVTAGDRTAEQGPAEKEKQGNADLQLLQGTSLKSSFGREEIIALRSRVRQSQIA